MQCSSDRYGGGGAGSALPQSTHGKGMARESLSTPNVAALRLPREWRSYSLGFTTRPAR